MNTWYENSVKFIKYRDGTIVWYKGSKVHRDDDLPAIILPNGNKRWYKNGKLHRENDLPAVIEIEYVKSIIAENRTTRKYKWYYKGMLHRKLPNPSYIRYNMDGYECITNFYVHGVRYYLNDQTDQFEIY